MKSPYRTLQANKTTLAAHSKYFEGSVSFADSELSFDPKIITFEVLDKLVKFMESDVFKPTMDDVELLFYSADYLQIESAIKILVEFLHVEAGKQMKNLEATPKEYLLVYLRLYPTLRSYELKENYDHTTQDISHFIQNFRGSNVLRPVCIRFLIAANFKKVINELPVLELSEENLFEILSSDDLRVSEEDVLRTCKMWTYYDMSERRDAFPRLVRCIRADKTMTVSGKRSNIKVFVNYIIIEFLCYSPSTSWMS